MKRPHDPLLPGECNASGAGARDGGIPGAGGTVGNQPDGSVGACIVGKELSVDVRAFRTNALPYGHELLLPLGDSRGKSVRSRGVQDRLRPRLHDTFSRNLGEDDIGSIPR